MTHQGISSFIFCLLKLSFRVIMKQLAEASLEAASLCLTSMALINHI